MRDLHGFTQLTRICSHGTCIKTWISCLIHENQAKSGGEKAPSPKDNNQPSDFRTTKAVERCGNPKMWKMHRNNWEQILRTRQIKHYQTVQESTGQHFLENWSDSTSKPGKALLSVAANRKRSDSEASNLHIIFTLFSSATTICSQCQWPSAQFGSLWYLTNPRNTPSRFHPSLNQVPGLCHPGQIHCETFK